MDRMDGMDLMNPVNRKHLNKKRTSPYLFQAGSTSSSWSIMSI